MRNDIRPGAGCIELTVVRDRSLFMGGGGGVAPKRKGLGKQNFE